MPDLALIQGTISSLKAAGDIASGLLKLHTMAEVQGKVIELQSTILAAQGSALSANADQAAMVEEIRGLKEEIARIKAWEAQKQRYQLASPWQGTLVYALKKQCSDSEPAHWLCTKCYEDGAKGFLNSQETNRELVAICTRCKTQFSTPWKGGRIEFKYHEDIPQQ